MKTEKYYFLLKFSGLFLLLILSSCKSFHPLIKYNYFDGNTLYNKEIDMSIDFFGDIKFNTLEKNEIKNKIEGIKDIDQRNLLVFGSTNVSPKYDVFLFFKNSKKKPKDTTEYIKLLIKDTIQNVVLYKKSRGNKNAFVLLKGINNNNIKSILIDGLSLSEKISFNSDLKKLTFSKVFETYKEHTNYLFVREKLKNAPIVKSKENEWIQFQYLITINSFMSNNIEYDSLINKFAFDKKTYLSTVLDTLFHSSEIDKANDVIEKITSLSKKTRVVMLNENHWCPENRLLAIKLLNPLKNSGYTHLALEALYKDQDSLLNNVEPYPKINTGYYTREPFFGHLIREAKDLGFTIIGYEDFNNSIDREVAQAKNLKKILDNNSNNKVFVYAGFDHIYEEETSKGSRRMASFFKELTNINPLTIDQVNIVSNIRDELIMMPSYLFKHNDRLWKPVDYFVINNLSKNFKEIYPHKEFKEIRLMDDFLILNKNKDLLISVYYEEEYSKYKNRSVPIISIIRKTSAENTVDLILPEGNLVIRICTTDNTSFKTFSLSV
ncbi:hypothetical protein [Confluentibacter sediminis]|uniref:hypothetical protein n=1 Tax=Confluentibacter sediminis TaxID=2219045 RepID=UPI0013A6AC87|nr:hypothetical protein [Confluentibacter sediminis]